MSDVYVIEVGGRAVGLVARDENGKTYRFHAAIPRAYGLDGRTFQSPDEAQNALRLALGKSSARSPAELVDAA